MGGKSTPQGFAVRADGVLAGRIDRVARHTHQPGHGGHDGNLSPCPGCHGIYRRVNCMKYAADVGGKAFLCDIGERIAGIPAHADPGVGDHQVQRLLGIHLMHPGLHGGTVGHIHGLGGNFCALFAATRGYGLQPRRVTATEGKENTRSGIMHGQSLANAAGAAGNQDIPGILHICFSLIGPLNSPEGLPIVSYALSPHCRHTAAATENHPRARKSQECP